jgi:hypothetical protein
MPVNSTCLNPFPAVHEVDASAAQYTAFARPRASPELMVNKCKNIAAATGGIPRISCRSSEVYGSILLSVSVRGKRTEKTDRKS